MFDSGAFDIDAFSEDAFNFNGVAPPVVVAVPNSGGWGNWYDIFEHQRRRKEKQKQEDEEVLENLETKVDREIAQLLRKQQAQDDQRKELERVKQLVQKYTDLSPKISSDRVNKAIEEAKIKQTLASYEKLQKEFIRMMEEEELQVMLSLLL